MNKNKKDVREEIFDEVVHELNKCSYKQQCAIADAAGIHIMTIYWWTSGLTVNPRINNVIRVARAMGFPIKLDRSARRALKKVS